MPDKKIYILTGSIQSGKTTRLLQWSVEKKNVFGILTPVVEGKKVFMDAHTKEHFAMEAEPGEEEILSVGRFAFSKKAFEKAIDILNQSVKAKKGWLIIDEIGPLELEGKGFFETVKQILSNQNSLNLLFIIREHLVEKAIDFFKLERNKIVIVKTDSEFFS